jgi:phage gp45-like
MQALEAIGQLVRSLRVRVDAMVARAVIEYVNDGLKTQRLQVTVLADEVADDVEHMQPYGVSFVPPAGAECVTLAIGGARSHLVAIGANAPGERPTGGKPRTGGLYTKGEWRLFVDDAGVLCAGAKDSTEHIPLGDAFLAAFNAHTHPIPTPGASAATSTPTTPLQSAAVLSRHKIAP